MFVFNSICRKWRRKQNIIDKLYQEINCFRFWGCNWNRRNEFLFAGTVQNNIDRKFNWYCYIKILYIKSHTTFTYDDDDIFNFVKFDVLFSLVKRKNKKIEENSQHSHRVCVFLSCLRFIIKSNSMPVNCNIVSRRISISAVFI